MIAPHAPNPGGTTQLPCGCVVHVKSGDLGQCTGQCLDGPNVRPGR